MTRSARVRAFAKLNLGLRILYRRADGFHELRTVFQTISLADKMEIAVTPARRTSIEIAGAQIPDNIVARAAERVLGEMKMNAQVQFTLTKKIPAGAGLGGGSTDAAAVLLALPVLAGRRVETSALSRMAAELGSDVPFFLYGGTAVAAGRGEELYPLDAAPRGVPLLIASGIHSSTAEAYRDLSPTLTAPERAVDAFQAHAWSGSLHDLTNDFEPVVFGRHPRLRTLRNRLNRAGARTSAMTGSGSALFGIFDHSAVRSEAMKAFRNEQAYAISFLSRARYQAAWKRALKSHTKGDQWPPQSLYAR